MLHSGGSDLRCNDGFDLEALRLKIYFDNAISLSAHEHINMQTVIAK